MRLGSRQIVQPWRRLAGFLDLLPVQAEDGGLRQAPLLPPSRRRRGPTGGSQSRRGYGGGRPGSGPGEVRVRSAGRRALCGVRLGAPRPACVISSARAVISSATQPSQRRSSGPRSRPWPPRSADPALPSGAWSITAFHQPGTAVQTEPGSVISRRYASGGRELAETSSPPQRSSLKENVRGPTARTSTSDSGAASPRVWLPTRTAASAPAPPAPPLPAGLPRARGQRGRPADIPGCVSRRS